MKAITIGARVVSHFDGRPRYGRVKARALGYVYDWVVVFEDDPAVEVQMMTRELMTIAEPAMTAPGCLE